MVIPRYSDIWDVDVLLTYLETLHPPQDLNDYMLGVKTCTLLTIFSLSRASTIKSLAPQYQLKGDDLVIPIVTLEKQSRPGSLYIIQFIQLIIINDVTNDNTFYLIQ